MKFLSKSFVALFALCALAESAYPQVPSSNDTSDGSGNTGMGTAALDGPSPTHSIGSANTAVGQSALFDNATGDDNTASGYQALFRNSSGTANTASGYEALLSNSTGNFNTASGYEALHANTTGAQNSALGTNAMFKNHAGNYNTASGTNALYSNTTGSENIAEGYKAGYNLTTGSNNIDIGNQGVAGESNTIRIGNSDTQTAVFIAGAGSGLAASDNIFQLSVNTSTGQLGIAPLSSERFKTGITPMGSASARLDELRPVMFQYKSDPRGSRQYGLIAEEVAKIYPELVVHDAKGQALTVRYDELAPMLLNEMRQQNQKLRDELARQDLQLAAQASEMRRIEEELKSVSK